MMPTVFSVIWEDPAHAIRLEQKPSGLFRVTYGLHVRECLHYMEAAHEVGECLMHALACEGKLNIG